jgi:hypothetical protein
MQSALNTLDDIKAFDLTVFSKGSGKLTALENYSEVPWEIKRVFVITNEDFEVRGNHAHKECCQALVAISGKILVKSFDGSSETSFTLLPMEKILCVPPHIWIDLEMSGGSALMVLTNKYYDENDYIRDKEEFLKFRNKS